MTEDKLIEYSKIYLKNLSKANFLKEVIHPSSARVKAFLPLYCAINRSYGHIEDPDMLEKSAFYLKMLEKRISKNDIYKKFVKSLDSHYYIQEEKEKQNQEAYSKILSIIKKYNISSYKLNKKYGVNAKIANDLINGKKTSFSLPKKIKLIQMLDHDLDFKSNLHVADNKKNKL